MLVGGETCHVQTNLSQITRGTRRVRVVEYLLVARHVMGRDLSWPGQLESNHHWNTPIVGRRMLVGVETCHDQANVSQITSGTRRVWVVECL